MAVASGSVPAAAAAETGVSSRAGRRRLTVEYKTWVVQEAERWRGTGDVGALLRREGLFSSQLTMWRKQYQTGVRHALSQKRGAKVHVDEAASELARVQRANAHLRDGERRLGGRPRDRVSVAAHRDRTAPDSTAAVATRADAGEHAHVLAQLHAEQFLDHSPAQVYATLLDEDTYLGSPRTMYRILAAHHEVRERRAPRTHPTYAVPRLTATQPNQVWTWNITELKGPTNGGHFKLYVVLDLYSRYVVAWMLADRESVRLAQRLITTACRRQGIPKGQRMTHSDRGSVQTAKDWHALYEDLGIVRSLSRPRVSNDNPHSESLFKTTKYTAMYPGRFDRFAQAERGCTEFFRYYNHDHHHSSIAYLTPTTVHHGAAPTILAQRQQTLHTAYQHHPERFVNGAPHVPTLPPQVCINRVDEQRVVINTP